MSKSQKSRKSEAGGALKLAIYRRNLAKRLDAICVELDHMESHDPTGRVTDEEIQAMRAGALTALTLVRVALSVQDPRMVVEFATRCPRRLATEVMDIAAKAHMVNIERQG